MATTNDVLEELATPPLIESITLFLKCHKSTVLISATPDVSFLKLKQLLLAALNVRQISSLPGSATPVPQNANDIELAILKDKKDVTKGWIALETKEQDVTDNKSAKRKGVGKNNIHSDSPAGTGLSDGSLIAYRIKQHTQGQDEDVTMDSILTDPGWDVLFPSYEDEETAASDK